MSYPLAARLSDDELEAIRAVWSAASGKQWRVEARDKYTKLYAVCPPHMHDAYLMDLSSFDANGFANVTAIAAAPEHIERLLSAYETLRDHVDDVQRDWEDHLASVTAPELTWTSERPTVPGWYWRRAPSGHTDIGYVGPGHDDEQRMCFWGLIIDEMKGGAWCGPLAEPGEP